MKHPHWQYFLSIESDIITASKYVEINKENHKTFSIEFVRLLLSICSEIDVVSKLFCKKVNPTEWDKIINDLKKKKKSPNMDTYRGFISRHFPEFYKSTISLLTYNINVYPWEDFNKKRSPKWWSKHNKVKHERNQNYKYANLKNVIQSAAGLLILLAYYHGYDSYFTLERTLTPKLFSIDDKLLSGGVQWERPRIIILQSKMCNHDTRSEA